MKWSTNLSLINDGGREWIGLLKLLPKERKVSDEGRELAGWSKASPNASEVRERVERLIEAFAQCKKEREEGRESTD